MALHPLTKEARQQIKAAGLDPKDFSFKGGANRRGEYEGIVTVTPQYPTRAAATILVNADALVAAGFKLDHLYSKRGGWHLVGIRYDWTRQGAIEHTDHDEIAAFIEECRQET